jgi:hypothetical protein
MHRSHSAPVSTIAAAMTLSVLAAGCGSSASTATAPTSLTRCGVTLNGGNTLPAAGGTGTVTVSAARECSWSASAEGPWLSIRSGSTGQGEGTVQFAAAVNPDPVTRRGAIVLNDQRFEVTQAAGECVISLASQSASFESAGGNGHVDVQSSSALCTWAAQPEANWIALRSAAEGKGSSRIDFEVMPTTGPSRTGTIRIAGQTFTVTQGQGCTYAITPSSYAAGAAGGSGEIAVSTGPGCSWTAASGAPWLTLSRTEGTGPASLRFAVAPLPEGTRSGTAVVAGQTFSVTQSGAQPPPTQPPPPPPPPPAAECTFSIAPEVQDVSASGRSFDVTVVTSDACSWTSASGVPWITLNPASGSGGGKVQVTVAANTGEARTGTATIATRTLTVNQAGLTCSYSVKPTDFRISADERVLKIEVRTGSACPWTATSTAAWIAVTSGPAGLGNADVQITVARNDGEERSGTVTVAGQTVTVIQRKR